MTGPGDVLGGVNEGAWNMKRSVGTRSLVRLGCLRVLEVRNLGAGNERELAALEHEAAKIAHDRLCLDVEVP